MLSTYSSGNAASKAKIHGQKSLFRSSIMPTILPRDSSRREGEPAL
jgi:hypothetical protein